MSESGYIRRGLLAIIIFIVAVPSWAQVGNEWINFNQSYYKIPVGKDGIYRVSYAQLADVGFPVGAVDPRRMQLFHRGVEQAIYVDGEDDATFDPTDFVEFYGQRNDGTQDAELYRPSSTQPHKYINLYNDTTSYFLTVNPASVLGKRMEYSTDINVGGLPKEVVHTAEILNVCTEGGYWVGEIFADYIETSEFGITEGWSGAEIRQGSSLDYNFTTVVHGDVAQAKPQLELLLIGRNAGQHETNILAGATVGSLRAVASASFFGFTTYTVSVPLEWTDIVAGKITIRIMANGSGGEPDRISASYIKIDFSQTFASDGATEKYYNLLPNGGGTSYIEIQNPASSLRIFDVTDPSSVVRIRTTSTTTLNALIHGTSSSRKIFSTSNILTPAMIKPVSFRKITPGAQDYIIISHPLLRTAALGYADPVKSYAEYRASTAGGSYDTLLVNINQLYDQYNYGEISPLAIFHFMKHLCTVKPPSYLFLIGKGLQVNYDYYRKQASLPKYKDLVPTAGYPASDAFFTVGLAGTTVEEAVPTGRITAMSPTDVAAYLNKVKEMEVLPFNSLWRKNILHLSGGVLSGEPERFKAYMQDFQSVAEGYHLGGQVEAISKTSTDIKLINVSAEVNKGLNLVTFYGHSSPSATDFEIGFASDPVMGYNNPGKYPTLLMNGCNVGSFFLYATLFGEDWVNSPNRGAIGFLAESAYGFEQLLKQYTDTFYETAYGDSTFVYQGLGDIHKEVSRRFSPSPTVFDKAQVHGMILLGDPAVKLFGARKPDYEINNNNLFIESFDGGPISVNTDSFALRFIVRNFGRAKEDTLRVQIVRTYNDNSTATYEKLYMPVKYADTLTYVIKKDRDGGFGNNTFTVTLDAPGLVNELNEVNNTASKSFLIPLNGTRNNFPANFDIVLSTDVNLVLQTTDLLSGKRDFMIEMDTVASFDSGFKRQFSASGTVLAHQQVTLLPNDSTTYYWRTKLAQPLQGESTDWIESSFTYINGGDPGWAQAHFPQYRDNALDGLVEVEESKRIKFEETITNVSVTNFGSTSSTSFTNTSFKINGAEYNLYTQGGGCRNNSLNLVAFDKKTTIPYPANPFNGVGIRRGCGRAPMMIMGFQAPEMATGTADDLIHSVDNTATGDSVVLFTMGDASFSSWPASVKTKLGEYGISAAQISSFQPGEPIVIFGKKGSAPGTATVFRSSTAPVNSQTLITNKTLTGRATDGSMISALVGPSIQWKKMFIRMTEKEPVDFAAVDVYGVSLTNQETLLFSNVMTTLDLSSVNPTLYPYLRLVYKVDDPVNLTPSQLKHWIVTFEPTAEGILLYKGSNTQQIVDEGLDWSNEYAFVNISDRPFSSDSMSVQVEYFNNRIREPFLNWMKIKVPSPQDTTRFTIKRNTNGLGGSNDVNVFVNPHLIAEQEYDNNRLELPDFLFVKMDEFQPVLQITIDGRVVENGDFVSPNPVIEGQLFDENKINLKTDTFGVNLYLQFPCEGDDCNAVRIPFSAPGMSWFPATADSYFHFIYKPVNLPEGHYVLKADGMDAKGNTTGLEPYQVNFFVRYEDSLAIQSPYPNPSGSEVTFPFVSAGSSAPDDVVLQIETTEGRVIFKYAMNPDDFHVGVNNLRWDGADALGNRLSAGIYIYHFLVRQGSRQVHRNGKVALTR